MRRLVTLAGAVLGGVAIYALALALRTEARSSSAGPPMASDTTEAVRPEALHPVRGASDFGEQAPPTGGALGDPVPAESPGPPPSEGAGEPLPLGGLVFGRVLDAQGAAITERAHVTFYDPDGLELRVQTDAQGRYSMTGLGAGRWRLLASAMRHWRVVETVELAPAQDPLRHDFRLERAPMLKVRVTTPDGEPIHEHLRQEDLSVFGLLPVATLEDPGPVFSEVVGSYNNGFGVGSFWDNGRNGERLPPEYLGVLVLDRELPVHVSLVHYQGVLATRVAGVGAEEVAFVLDPEILRQSQAGLRVRLVDAETGEPLNGRVGLNDQRSWSPGELLDANGEVFIEGKPPGRYTLSFRADGLARVRQSVRLEAGRVLDLGTLALEPARSLRARVLDPSGEPADIAFELGERTLDPATVRFDWTHSYTSQDGELSIEGLSSGDYVLRAEGDEDQPYMAPTIEFSTRQGSVDDVMIQLVPAVCLSLQPSGAHLEEPLWRYRLFDEAGYRVAAGPISAWGRRLYLAPGSYDLELESPTGETSRESLGLHEPLTLSIP